jgi:hypothetical protein
MTSAGIKASLRARAKRARQSIGFRLMRRRGLLDRRVASLLAKTAGVARHTKFIQIHATVISESFWIAALVTVPPDEECRS